MPSIGVFTNFEAVFGDFVLGEIETETTCTSQVHAGATCESVRSTTVRPGSAVGPYQVTVGISAADSDDLVALVQPEPQGVLFDSRANAGLFFQERPSVEVETELGDITNNGDGTYTLDYSAVVTNTGDVPLYRTAFTDFGAEFGPAVFGNELVEDSCFSVSFGSPLGPAQTCERSQRLTIRPTTNLGPWVANTRVVGETPTFAAVVQDSDFGAVTFEEIVEIEAESSLTTRSNNGDGSYNVCLLYTSDAADE